MSVAPLSPAWASGLSGAIDFVSPEQLVAVCGPALTFLPASSLSSSPSLSPTPPSVPRHGISLLATCPRASMFGYTELCEPSTILIASFHPPEIPESVALKSPTQASVTALGFSRSGRKLASLCELPEPEITIWRVQTREIHITAKMGMPCSRIAFNPANDDSLCT
ncbi:MAG: hypothetical protein SGPRY_013895, partial [Prymnesium sp.]